MCVVMTYYKKISSLKEKALYQVALNLTDSNSFKEVAMCFEKPTYGFFIHQRWNGLPLYISGPEVLSACAKMKECKMKGDFQSFQLLWDSLGSKTKIQLWDDAVEEQCQTLTVGFPSSLKPELHVWINRVAMEYLSFSRRQELLFGVSRYFLMSILTRNDWTEAGRLNELKITKRLMNDERLTVLQQYQIACVYCLEINIAELWSRLTPEEKQSVSGPYCDENKSLVSLWSVYMNEQQNTKSARQTHDIWSSAAKAAVYYGNQTALTFCWEELQQHEQQQLIVDMAHEALEDWESADRSGEWKIDLLSDECCILEAPQLIKNFNLPSYYSELICFFLPKMSEEQMFEFFQDVFEREYIYFSFKSNPKVSILDCLLDWPVRDNFLPTLNLLWGRILPKYNFGLCLISLVRRYTGESKMKYNIIWYYKEPPTKDYYDYQNMLWNLWEDTPEEYKQYLFYLNYRESTVDCNTTPISKVLFQLLKKDPFQEKDVALFKKIWNDLPKEIKKAMIELRQRRICWKLLVKKKWSLVNWLLKESLPNVEIPCFKKQLIHTKCSNCFNKLEKKHYKFVKDVIDWCLELDSEKTQIRREIIYQGDKICKFFLSKGKFTEVETIVNFCLSSDEMKNQFKMLISRGACILLLEDYYIRDCSWELMDKIVAWYAEGEEEKIKHFKKFLFFTEGISTHYKLVFSQRKWENVEKFYRWFCLSHEEIIKVKKETVFMPKIITQVYEALCKDMDKVESSLRWCLIDEEMVTNFKEEVERKYFSKVLRKKNDKNKCFDHLVSKLLNGLKKEAVPGITEKDNTSVKDNSEEQIFCDTSKNTSVKLLNRKKFKFGHC